MADGEFVPADSRKDSSRNMWQI